MHQRWQRLLFLHWRIDPEQVTGLLPAGLTLDLFDGLAWVAATPFTLTGLRGEGLPPVPFLGTFHELNARTYVHRAGVPGVWFFSLDASSRLAVVGARRFYHLPYYKADMKVHLDDGLYRFRSERAHRNARPAHFEAAWTIGEPLTETVPGSLEFFLTERYVLFSAAAGVLYRARIHHRPWRLRVASLVELRSTLLEAASLPTPGSEPLVHYADAVDVEVWRPERACGFDGSDVAPGSRSA